LHIHVADSSLDGLMHTEQHDAWTRLEYKWI